MHAWNDENYDRVACSHYRSRYGISLAGVRELLEKQDYKCAICKTHIKLDGAKGRDKAAVDHCHETGTVRGLLCTACNLMLGYSRDRNSILRSAAEYLEEA